MSREPGSIEQTQALLEQANYVADRALSTTLFLALKMQRPLFLEGEAGVGKTEIAKVLSQTEHEPTGDSWLDHTTIVCASEFNRSPALNASGGRDHATNNCMLLLGGGIRHGAVIGESHPIRMAAQSIDPVTGLVDAENGVTIEHENVARSLLASIGITDDIADIRADPIPALLA